MYRTKRKDPALPNAICSNNSVHSAQQNDNATDDGSGATDRTAATNGTAQTDNDDHATNNGDTSADTNKDENDGDNSDTSNDEETSFPRWVRPADYRLRTTTTSRSKRLCWVVNRV